jgi:hypothetical protein
MRRASTPLRAHSSTFLTLFVVPVLSTGSHRRAARAHAGGDEFIARAVRQTHDTVFNAGSRWALHFSG